MSLIIMIDGRFGFPTNKLTDHFGIVDDVIAVEYGQIRYLSENIRL